jgi:hypothetical protein
MFSCSLIFRDEIVAGFGKFNSSKRQGRAGHCGLLPGSRRVTATSTTPAGAACLAARSGSGTAISDGSRLVERSADEAARKCLSAIPKQIQRADVVLELRARG